MNSGAWMIFALKAFFAVAGVLAVVVYVLVPLWRQLRSGPDPELFEPKLRLPDEEEEELEIPTGGARGKPDRQAILERARQDPRLTATLISNWLKQKN